MRRTWGSRWRLKAGLKQSDKIIINPSDSIADGDHVLIAPLQACKEGDVVKRARQWRLPQARLKAVMAGATVVASGAVLLSACTVGPDYKQPHADAPPAWHTDSYWRARRAVARAAGARLVDQFRRRIVEWLRTAGARAEPDARRRERALRAGTCDAREQHGAAGARSRSWRHRGAVRISQNRPLTNYATPTQSTVQNDIQVGPTINYDTDLFGRIRREDRGRDGVRGTIRDDLANARLVLTTDLASDYFSMRELDAEIDVLEPFGRAAAEGAGLRDHAA